MERLTAAFRTSAAFFGFLVISLCADISQAFDDDRPTLRVGEREVVATKKQRDSLQLSWFMDGNMGVVTERPSRSDGIPSDDTLIRWYAANGSQPVRITGSIGKPIEKVEQVTISTQRDDFRYLAGGPIYIDAVSRRCFLFYHAEIHRGSERNFYSVVGLAVQSDRAGLEFSDLGPVYMANVTNEDSKSTVEVCGAPYVIKDGYFYLYAKDVEGPPNAVRSNLSVARSEVAQVVSSGLLGTGVSWEKYFDGSFSQSGFGGRSSPLESGNPGTRWMDVTYCTTMRKFILVVAANSSVGRTTLYYSLSDDGIRWTDRQVLVDEDCELFYPSIVGYRENSRETGREFHLYYTFSVKGGWGRWDDAEIVRRKISIESVNRK